MAELSMCTSPDDSLKNFGTPGDRHADRGVSIVSMETASPSHAKVSFCMPVPCHKSMLETLCRQKTVSVCIATTVLADTGIVRH